MRHPSWPRRIARSIARLFAGLALVSVALVVFFGVFPAGTAILADLVEDQINTPDQTIEIGEVSGLLTGRVTVRSLTVSDRSGEWIRLGDVVLDWSPLALAGGRFSAERLSVETIALARLPKAPETEPDTTTAGFSLPVEVDIKAVSVADLSISRRVARRDFNLSVDGSLAADAAGIRLAADIRDEARPGAGVTARLDFDPAANRLDADLSLSEPKGGLVVALAGIAGEPALSADLTGSGPLNDWAGRLTVALDAAEVVALDARHIQAGDGTRRLVLEGGGALAGLVPARLKPYVEGRTAIALDASLGADGAVRIARAALDSGSLSLKAEGGFDLAGMSDLTVQLAPRTGTIAISLPRGSGEINAALSAASLRIFGPADSLDLSAELALPFVRMAEGAFSGLTVSAKASDFDAPSRSGNVTLVVTAAESRIENEDLDRLIGAPLTLTLPLTIAPERIATTGATLESATIGGTISGHLDPQTLDFAADTALFALGSEVLPPALAAREPGRIALSATLSGRLPGTITVSKLDIAADALTLTGALSLTDDTISANLAGRLPDLGRLVTEARGGLDIALDAEGPISAPVIKGTLRSDVLRLAGRTVSELVVEVDAVASAARPSAKLTARGAIDTQPIVADLAMTSTDGQIRLDGIKVAIGDNRLTGALSLSERFLPVGRIAFDLPDVSLVAALAGQTASGALTGQADLADADGKIALTVTASGDGLTQGSLRLVRPDIDLTTTDLASGQIAGRLRLAELSSGANRLEAIDLSFRPDGPATRFTLAGKLDGKALAADGAVTPTAAGLRLDLATLSAVPKGVPVSLTKPVAFVLADGMVRFDALTLAVDRGRVVASGSAGAVLDLALTLNDMPLALANTVSPGLGAQGTLSGTLTVKGAAADAKIAFDIKASGASAEMIRRQGLAALSATAKGTFAASVVSLSATARNASGLDLKADGRLSLGLKPSTDMTVSGRLPLALAEPVLAAQGFGLTGEAQLRATIKGGLLAPAISGTITAKGARLIDVRRNLAVNDIAAAIHLAGKEVVIERFSGTLSTGGTISARGTVGIVPGSGFPADIAVVLKDATYVQGELATANMAGDLTLTGPLLSAPKLGGSIRIRRAGITIPEKMPASLAAIDVKHRHQSAAISEQARRIAPKDKSGTTSSAFGVDLAITAPSQIFVRGRGLDAELGGSLTVSGDLTQPVVSGAFTMKRGRLSILGKRLDFSSGSISFGGGLVPILNLVASSVVNGTTVNVTVSGPADNPVIGFSSNPALPEDEVLALLIFARSKGNLSAFQIAQLADAAAQLAGGRSSSLFDSLRKGIGVDDLDVTTDDAGNTSVKAGKYINKRTYIELQQGAQPGTSKAVINLDIGKGLKLQGGASSDGTGSAGIVYEKEY